MKKTPIFVTPFTFEISDICFEENKEPSLTVPGQSLSINEILYRFTTNTLPNIQKQQFYDENPDYDHKNIHLDGNFDLVDYSTALNNINNNLQNPKIPDADDQKTIQASEASENENIKSS